MNQTKFLGANECYELEQIFAKYVNRDTLMLELLYRYGMRSHELLGVAVADVNIQNKTLFVKGAKSSNSREFPLSDELFLRLLTQMGNKAPSERIFPFHYNTLRGIWQVYRPVKKTLHALRHSVGVRLYKQTKDLRFVQKVLGHKSILNTQIYETYVYTQEEFRRHLLGSDKATEPSYASGPGEHLQLCRNS